VSNRPSRPGARLWEALSAIALVAAANTACGDPRPLWELGLGAGAVAIPDYPGSSVTHVYPIPVIYFIYRGEFFRSDRDGVRGLLLNREYVELSVSAGLSVPVNSNKDAARYGMPNLHPVVELGPALNVHLWKSADRHVRLDLRLPLRAGLTLESHPQSIGWIFGPRLDLDIDGRGRARDWSAGVLVGPDYASERYHEYFYGVAPQYATPERPAYQAPGGYGGTWATAYLSHRGQKVWFGAYITQGWLANAAFATSPLVRRDGALSGGFGVAWMLGRSTHLVESVN
jgi:outer membrane scaffolding protein for murein synthesis (MipA/OmpV family)